MKKYDTKFNFFFAKPISQIIYNHTTSSSTLDYKDIVIYSETNQYLKRTYHIKNNAGRNQIYDRIQMLADFYNNAVMLKYEHPMMIISHTKDIFLKRIKRMKKMIASDCSSQQNEQHLSQRSSQIQSFSSSIFLKSIKSNQIQSSSQEQSLIKNCKKSQRSYDTQLYDIFDHSNQQQKQKQQLDLRDTIYRPILQQETYKFKIKQTAFQNGLAHLIFDLDDFDRDKTMRQYKKIQQTQNTNTNTKLKQKQKQKTKQNQMIKKSSIIITAIDHNPVGDLQSQQSMGANMNYYPKNSKNMKKQSGINRYKQQYDQTIRVSNYNNFGTGGGDRNYDRMYNNYNSRNAIRQQQGPSYRSPSFGSSPNFVQGNSTERNYGSMQSSHQYQPQPYPNLRYQQPQPPIETRKYPMKQPMQRQRQRIYTQNPYKTTTTSTFLHPNPNYQQLNQIPTQQNQTIYITHQNSVSQVSNKAQRKQYVREKAVALLQKVKSEQKLPIFYEEEPKRLTRYPTRNRITTYQ